MKISRERQSYVIAGKWPEEHKPMTESPNIETIVEDDHEEDANDDKFFCFFCGRDFKTKQGCSIHQRNCDEAH